MSEAPDKPAGPSEIGRLIARVLCVLFALIGALPLLLASLVSSGPLQRWAERETARILREELGVSARYRVEIRLLPLRLSVNDLVVPAADGGSPALSVESVTVAPRVFALFGGRLDLGEIELKRPRARLVVKEGKLTNVAYRLPQRPSSGARSQRAPFTSLSVTEGRFQVAVDGVTVDTGPVDLDVFAERGPSFEIALQADESRVVRRRVDRTLEVPTTEKEVQDEDLLCRLEARLRVEPDAIDVRRLALLGSLDDSVAPGRGRGCRELGEADPQQISARVSQLHVALRGKEPPLFAGHVSVRAPLAVLNRFVRTLPLKGWAAFAGDMRFDGSSKLPELEGKLTGKGLGLGGYMIAQDLDIDARVARDVIELARHEMGFADGRITLKNVRIEPLAPGVPLSVESMDQENVAFPSLMRDVNVTPDTIVAWDIKETHAKKIRGTLAPLHVEGELSGETRDFEVFDRAFHDPARKHMIGVKRASLRGRFRVVPQALEFLDMRTDFGNSSILVKYLSIGFANKIVLSIGKDSRIDLADVSPLVDIQMAGKAELDAEMAGRMSDPELTGNLKLADFQFGGFPIGDIKSAKIRFRPLFLELADVDAQKGRSSYTVPSARLDFDAGATIVADAKMKSAAFDLRDFLSIWRFDEDPRWAELAGETAVDASVRYVLGGKEDPCDSGVLVTKGKVGFRRLELFGERYDSGDADYRLRWFDRDAGYHAIELSLPSLALRKGSGAIVGSVEVRPGAKISGQLVASDVPVSKIDALPQIVRAAEGRASAVAELSGTLDELEATATARLSPLRIGRATLPASNLRVELTPLADATPVLGRTRCGAPVKKAFDQGDFEADRASGVFQVDGALFGGQVTLERLTVTRQGNKLVRGRVGLVDLDLGAAAELVPALALSDSRLDGKLRGTLDLSELRTADPLTSKARLTIEELQTTRGGYSVRLLPGSAPIELAGGSLRAPGIALVTTTPNGHQATFDFSGGLTQLRDAPRIDGELTLRPMDLSALTQAVPRVERARGSVTGRLALSGPLRSPAYTGGFELTGGEVLYRGLATPFTDVSLALALEGGELNVKRGTARLGSGRLSVSGGAPLRGLELGAARLELTARDLSLPLGEDIRSSADADLLLSWKPPANGERSLPRLSGNLLLRSLEYRRPVAMTAAIQSLGRRGKRTEVDAYDPSEDMLELDITLRAARSLQIRNELIEADLLLSDEGLLLAGTNGRFGLRGTVEIKPGGRIMLRRSVFDISQGTVRFDDTTRIAPKVDVTASTEYRRYADASNTTAGAQTTTSAGSSSTNVSGGRWNIRMHAHGDADDLKIDLTSEPALAQDDVFLLLTVGLTRAELDQAQSASVGESVALEALGTLSGADKAVTNAVPVIDEFRFGSSYSSRTGRTEPTVTIGKRLTDRVRANVTTGLAESREVRSNVEWRLNNRVSVESSYDNVNDISSSALGNLGADIRWRLEFE
ncbi:MAG TPA: translocation/assembly module TamB domain-containing protein [Polyangiaceae bacterium]